MKKRFLWFTFLVSFLSVVALYFIILFHYDIPLTWSDILMITIPLFIIIGFVSYIFNLVMWQPIDQFMESLPEYTDIEKDSMVRVLNRIIKRYDKQAIDTYSQLSILYNMLNHVEEGIIILNQDESLFFYNYTASSVFHIAMNEQQKWLWEIIRSTELLEVIRKTIHEKKDFFGEITLLTPLETTISYQSLPLTDRQSGTVWKSLFCFRDVTKIKKLEMVRSDFVSNVSHELKSPLTAMLGYSELLLADEAIEPSRQQKYHALLHKNVLQLIEIVNDLLVLSKIENGEKVNLTTFSLTELFHELEELFTQKIKEKSHQVSFELNPPELSMHADKLRIRQMLVNLIDNAIKFTPSNGSILVSAKKETKEIIIDRKSVV